MSAPTYFVEVWDEAVKSWRRLWSDSRAYCLGYLQRAQESPGPRVAMRLVKETPTTSSVESSVAGRDDVSIGQVAGHPTPEQYRAAGLRALEHADAIEGRRLRHGKLDSDLSPPDRALLAIAAQLARGEHLVLPDECPTPRTWRSVYEAQQDQLRRLSIELSNIYDEMRRGGA